MPPDPPQENKIAVTSGYLKQANKTWKVVTVSVLNLLLALHKSKIGDMKAQERILSKFSFDVYTSN